MGAKNLDRIPFAAKAQLVNTIADMRRAGWRIHTQCEACGLKTRPSYALLIKLLGPAAELWDRRPPCLRDSCGSRQTYWAAPPGDIARPLIAAERFRGDGL